jgi:hypothetical protein
MNIGFFNILSILFILFHDDSENMSFYYLLFTGKTCLLTGRFPDFPVNSFLY